MWARVGPRAGRIAWQLHHRSSRWFSVAASDSTKNCTACIEHLAKVAQESNGLCNTFREIPKEWREAFAAEVIRASLKDGELEGVVDRLDTNDVRALGLLAMSKHFGKDFRTEFQALDEDHSGTICQAEFRRYLTSVLPEHHAADASAPTTRQLWLFALNSAIPFVVFGFLDNSIMIVGGDVVDDLIGSTFHLSTLACAALANTFADVLGISIGNSVEALTGRLGLPKASLTTAQSQLPWVRRVGLVSGSLGILVGCLLGMTPLLFIDEEKKEEKKALREIFARLDVNQTGLVELQEVTKAFRAAGIAATEDHIAEVVKSLDLDHDGKVSAEDLQQVYGRLKAISVNE